MNTWDSLSRQVKDKSTGAVKSTDTRPVRDVYAQGMMAPQYSALTFPVVAGAHCIYEGELYAAKQDIAASEAWTAAHWDKVQLGAEVAKVGASVADLKSQLSDVEEVLPKSGEWVQQTSDINSGYYDRNGVQKSSAYANYAILQYTGQIIKVTCAQMPNNTTIAPIVYLDSQGGLVGVEPSDSATSMSDYALTVPSGTAQVVINITVNNTLYVYYYNAEYQNVASAASVQSATERLPYINVKQYNAVGDGTTNDRTAIQNALNAAETAGGGTVFFPKGTYNLVKEGTAFAKAYLYVPSNTTLLFESGAVIKRGDTYSAHIFITKNANDAVLYAGAHNITFDGATIDAGNGENWATSICLSHADNVSIKNCVFKNGAGNGHYIEVNSSRFVSVSDCDFHESETMIMYIQIEAASGHGNAGQNDDTPAYNVDIRRCRISKKLVGAMAICAEDADDPSNNIRIHECLFCGDTDASGFIKFPAGVKDVDIYNNTFVAGETSASRAVVIGDVTGSCTVHDNRFGTFVSAIDGTPVKYNNMIAGELVNS